jgi:hypothetical protein
LATIAGKVNNTCIEKGTLPIQAFSNKQAEKPLKMDLLGSYPVQVERYASLSPSWGIFTTDSLDDMTDEEEL